MEGAPAGTGIIEPFVSLLVSMGLPGLVIAGLGYIGWRLWGRTEKQQEALLEITRETVKAQEAATAAVNRLSDLLVRGRAPE